MSNNKKHPRREKAKTVVLSIAAAIIVWAAIMWVDNPDITTTVSGLDIRFIGETDLRERGFVITGKKDIPEMSVVVRGKRSELMDYMEDICIEVDSSDINEAGEYVLPGKVFLPSSQIFVEKEKYEDISINVEKLETKEIEVKVKQTGTVKDSIIGSEVENPEITISGAKSELDEVAYGLATVDISNISSYTKEPVSYVLMDSNDNLINKNETITAESTEVDVVNTIYKVKNLPIMIELSPEIDEKYLVDMEESSVTPSSIDVGILEYNVDTAVKAIVTDVDENGNAEYELAVSDGMYIPEESKSVKIKTELKKKVSKKLELDVQAENPPAGEVNIERISATVWGEEINLNTDNVKAYVDLKDLEPGSYLLPVKISGDGISVKEEYSVRVTIEE